MLKICNLGERYLCFTLLICDTFYIQYVHVQCTTVQHIPCILYIYIKINYKSHVENFIKTSTVCFALSAHQELIVNTDERYIIKMIKHIKLIS